MGLKMPSSKKMRELTGERRSPSKSRERRLAEVAWIVSVEMEVMYTNGIRPTVTDIGHWSKLLHSAIQELRK